jgi:REP element-mobilizing transposase RayT
MKVGDMKKSHEYYRDGSRRLESWDYSTPGGYFITICTHLKRPYFGKIIKGKLHLSSIGNIVAEEWEKTGSLRKNVDLDEYIVMPNHLHGIIILQNVVGTRASKRQPI